MKESTFTINFKSCGSTNDLAREYAENGFPTGTVIRAEKQTGGRGRWGRTWKNGEGNFLFSVIVKFSVKLPENSWLKNKPTLAPLATATLIIQAITETFGRADLKIKWPNDIYFYGKKLCGNLCEGFQRGSERTIIVGVGLNVQSSPLVLENRTVCLKDIFPNSCSLFDQEILFQSLVRHIADLGNKSFDEVIHSYQKYAFFRPGQTVEWIGREGRQMSGIVQGLGDFGELIISGQRLFSDESYTLRTAI